MCDGTGSGPGGDMAAAGDSLVGAAPAGPAEKEVVPLGRLGQQPEPAADLRDGRRDSSASALPVPPSRAVARQVTSR